MNWHQQACREATDNTWIVKVAQHQFRFPNVFTGSWGGPASGDHWELQQKTHKQVLIIY